MTIMSMPPDQKLPLKPAAGLGGGTAKLELEYCMPQKFWRESLPLPIQWESALPCPQLGSLPKRLRLRAPPTPLDPPQDTLVTQKRVPGLPSPPLGYAIPGNVWRG